MPRKTPDMRNKKCCRDMSSKAYNGFPVLIVSAPPHILPKSPIKGTAPKRERERQMPQYAKRVYMYSCFHNREQAGSDCSRRDHATEP